MTSLNPDQEAIVHHQKQAALVIAGAGSGKTRVITHRVKHLVESGVEPSTIMMLTFTNKAAAEMAERVAHMIGSAKLASAMVHGTFHSVAARFLRYYAKLIGYDNQFTVLDATDARDLVKASITEVVGKPEKQFPNARILQNAFSLAFNKNASTAAIANTSFDQRHFNLETFLGSNYPNFETWMEEILKIHKQYRQKKRRNKAMDFDDLLENWLVLLTQHWSSLKQAHQIEHILVDEYQDTNQIQADILGQLAQNHGNLMVVGDDAQAIYGWRGANFRNILEFPNLYESTLYRLEENYRSTPEILELANASINFNKEQFTKNLYTQIPSSHKPTLYRVDNPSTEAQLILELIQEQQDQEVSLNDISILYRNHAQAVQLQLALIEAGVPFVIHSGVKFFEQAHIKDITAFLKVLFNPLDEVAWMRILKMLPGVGNVTAQRIFRVFVDQKAVRLSPSNTELQNLIPARARSQWTLLLECFQKMLQDTESPAEMLKMVHKGFYRDYFVMNYDDVPQREMDIEYLYEFAARYKRLETLLSELALVGSSIIKDYETEQQAETENLTLTTIHQAKGLEWEVVFVIGLTDGQFPHKRSMESLAQMEEERRLFYVATTRARRHLVLSSPLMGTHFDFQSPSRRSRFVEELPEDLLTIETLETPQPDYAPYAYDRGFVF